MIRELQLRILPEQAASEQSIAAYVAREQSMDIRSIKSVRVLKRSIDARQRTVMVNLKVRVYIDEFPQDDEFPRMRFSRTSFVGIRRQVAMTAHPATGESLLQLMHQQPERCPLFRCPCVRRASPAVQAAFVANSDTLRIKTFRMCPDPFHRTGKMRCSILADIVMITCPVKSPPTVHRIQIKSRLLLVCPRCRTVNHN